VLEFDPQVLKRFVNFMNNPDEKTAVEQFGDGDKYFGICTLLATLPGLPMFGHGQVEGFHEKYGMEFRRPKWDESPNDGLIKGHEWRIFPLLHQRRVFADVENFLLYDFYTSEGYVNEDVFVHSNRFQEERGLVVYHNKYAETRGWIKTSAAFMDKGSGNLVQKTMDDGLALPNDGYAIFQDYVTHLEYIRSCHELLEKGLYVVLGGYQCHAFLDWHFVSGEQWSQVCSALNGAGVPSMQAKFDEMFGEKKEETSEKDKGISKKKKIVAKQKAKKAAVKSAVKKSEVGKKTTTASKKPAVKPKAKPAAKVTKSVAKKATKKTKTRSVAKKAVKKPATRKK
jgi:hypothetical protein